MPIKKINKGGSGDNTERRIQDATKSIHKVMQYAGESSLKYARINGNFHDRTGNLRSSEGYSVVQDKSTVAESANVQFLGGSEGVSESKSLRAKLAATFGKGITLFVLAGMDYAHEVEAKGYDVLTGSELRAKQMVPRLLRKLGFIIK